MLIRMREGVDGKHVRKVVRTAEESGFYVLINNKKSPMTLAVLGHCFEFEAKDFEEMEGVDEITFSASLEDNYGDFEEAWIVLG